MIGECADGRAPVSPQGIEERCERRALGQHDQCAEQDQKENNRREPPLLIMFQKLPELQYDRSL